LIAKYAKMAKVTAVAEPNDDRRKILVKKHKIAPSMVFKDWREFLKMKRTDAVVVSTMDREHVGPALASLDLGCDLLLEKPMAVTLKDCEAIAAAQERTGRIVTVCHSMRYHSGFAKVKELLDSGVVGDIVTLDQLEQVAYWHYAHAFIRGNWANEGRSSFMLLAKSCHDLDYISYLIGKPCKKVSSFGALNYFKRENAPAGSTDRCTDGCAVERTCPFSAIKLYTEGNLKEWPAAWIGTEVHTKKAHMDAIKTGRFGRCVWRADNDVVDHQVVLMEFGGNVTATFTMTGFTQRIGRIVRINGTKGELLFDEEQSLITLRVFGKDGAKKIKIRQESGGHGGSDERVVKSWLTAITTRDPSGILTDARESLKTHRVVFAAEQSRREGRIVDLT
jgi:predicted dehydrogenase